MTKKEFSEGLFFLAAGCRQSLETPTLEAYFAMLGDLSADVFRSACRLVLLTHKFATLPSIRTAPLQPHRACCKRLVQAEGQAHRSIHARDSATQPVSAIRTTQIREGDCGP